MIILKYDDSNNNKIFLERILNKIQSMVSRLYWSINDLYIVPLYIEDINGFGKEQFKDIAFELQKSVDNEKVVFLEYSEFKEVLKKVRTIYSAVIMGFPVEVEYNYQLRARVNISLSKKNNIQNEDAIVEIRIIEGYLFEIISRNSNIENLIETELNSYILNTNKLN